jgi:uncharacterized protein YdeI (YjbR/CyaY-like superfamily)
MPKADRRRLRGLPIRLFKRGTDWTAWLEKHHTASRGLWLRLAKKHSGIISVSYTEALDVALCYGWIDGQGRRYDASSWLLKFTPRGTRSIWSKRNRQRVRALIKTGRMKPSGLAAVTTAKRTGRWQAAYDSPRAAVVPKDFQAAMNRVAPAKAFFATLDRRNKYAIFFRVTTAKKADTRARRIQQFVRMLAEHRVLHP